MKNIAGASLLLMLLTSCVAQKSVMIKEINALHASTPVQDSLIEKLRKDNDLLIIAAVINTAWARSTTYNVLVKKGEDWKGIIYFKNQMPANGQPDKMSEIKTDKESCDSLAAYIENTEAWKVSGDGGKDFCTDKTKRCMIYDGSHSQLMLVTPGGYASATYYAPEFFERCCPGNEQRALFVSVVKKVNGLFTLMQNNQ